MQIKDLLSNKEKDRLQSINKSKPMQRKKKPKQERLTNRDLRELMGTSRDTYTRRNGAVRRK